MPCCGSAYNILASTFKDSDVVKVKFIWSDYENQHTVGVWPLTFSDSNIEVTGCGFSLNRHRSSYDPTFMNLNLVSGHVTFANCLFRNARVCVAVPENNATMTFTYCKVYDDNASTQYWKYADFKQDYIGKYFLPTVFVDDNVGNKTINGNYISLQTGARATCRFIQPYLVFKGVRRELPVVRAQPSNTLLFYPQYSRLMQILIEYATLQSFGENCQCFRNDQLTTITWNEASSADGATANTINKQLQIWLKTSFTTNMKPEWLTTQASIFRFHAGSGGTSSGYDAASGVYNQMAIYLRKDESNYAGIVHWNDTTIPSSAV